MNRYVPMKTEIRVGTETRSGYAMTLVEVTFFIASASDPKKTNPVCMQMTWADAKTLRDLLTTALDANPDVSSGAPDQQM